MYSGLAEAKQIIKNTKDADQMKLLNALLVTLIMVQVGAKGHLQVVEMLKELE